MKTGVFENSSKPDSFSKSSLLFVTFKIYAWETYFFICHKAVILSFTSNLSPYIKPISCPYFLRKRC